VKALLKKIEVLGKDRKSEDYLAEIRGILTRNNIPYKEVDGVVELEQPAEVCVYSLRDIPTRFTYVLKFEDEAEKSVLHQNIKSIKNDGTTLVVLEDHYIYLPKDWREKSEVEVAVDVEWSKSCVMEHVIGAIERKLEGLEKTYTIKVTNWMLKKLRDVDATKIRDVLEKVFINADHVVVYKYEYDELKGENAKLKDEIKELEGELSKLKEKYDALTDFIKANKLQEEFVKFLTEKEKEEKEEGIKEEYEELFEEEEEE